MKNQLTGEYGGGARCTSAHKLWYRNGCGWRSQLWRRSFRGARRNGATSFGSEGCFGEVVCSDSRNQSQKTRDAWHYVLQMNQTMILFKKMIPLISDLFSFTAGKPLTIEVVHADGSTDVIQANITPTMRHKLNGLKLDQQ